jgi:hypothetical protein
LEKRFPGCCSIAGSDCVCRFAYCFLWTARRFLGHAGRVCCGVAPERLEERARTRSNKKGALSRARRGVSSIGRAHVSAVILGAFMAVLANTRSVIARRAPKGPDEATQSRAPRFWVASGPCRALAMTGGRKDPRRMTVRRPYSPPNRPSAVRSSQPFSPSRALGPSGWSNLYARA